jgi:hypothetical protein
MLGDPIASKTHSSALHPPEKTQPVDFPALAILTGLAGGNFIRPHKCASVKGAYPNEKRNQSPRHLLQTRHPFRKINPKKNIDTDYNRHPFKAIFQAGECRVA